MIFEEQLSRKPDHYPWTHKYVNAMHDNPWTDRKFSFTTDLHDFKVNFTDQERTLITRALSLIGQIEVSVKKFWGRLGDNLPHPSISDLGFVMANVEVIHGNAYERLLEVLGIYDSFDEILKLDIIKGRINYLRKHLHKFHDDNKRQFVYSLILFTLFIENVALFSQFYTICWFKKFKNQLKDTNKQVEYTSREEMIHAFVGMDLVNEIRKEHPELFDEQLEKKVLHEAEQIIKYQGQINEWMLEGTNEENLNAEVLNEFDKNRLNESLVRIKFPVIFEVDKEKLKKTKWFDEMLIASGMQDFFDGAPVEYSRNQKVDEDEELW